MNNEDLTMTMEDIEQNSEYVQSLVEGIVSECCDKLDDFITYVAGKLNNSDKLTDEELEEIIMIIPTQLYFVGTQQEKLGVKHDVSDSNRKILYNKLYMQAQGTAGVRKATAESELFNEELVSIIYDRAYNIIKCKVSCATEILQSAKKVISRRMSELELSKVTPNRMKG